MLFAIIFYRKLKICQEKCKKILINNSFFTFYTKIYDFGCLKRCVYFVLVNPVRVYYNSIASKNLISGAYDAKK